MAEAHARQAEPARAEALLDEAERVFPGEELLREKRNWVRRRAKEASAQQRRRLQKMFAKKKH